MPHEWLMAEMGRSGSLDPTDTMKACLICERGVVDARTPTIRQVERSTFEPMLEWVDECPDEDIAADLATCPAASSGPSVQVGLSGP
jgi:hypothetical protein